MSAPSARDPFANVTFVDFTNHLIRKPDKGELKTPDLLEHVLNVCQQLTDIEADQWTGGKFSFCAKDTLPLQRVEIHYTLPCELSLAERFSNAVCRWRPPIAPLPRGEVSFTILGRDVAYDQIVRHIDNSRRSLQGPLAYQEDAMLTPSVKHNYQAATDAILRWALRCASDCPGMKDTIYRKLRNFDWGPNENGYAPGIPAPLN